MYRYMVVVLTWGCRLKYLGRVQFARYIMACKYLWYNRRVSVGSLAVLLNLIA